MSNDTLTHVLYRDSDSRFAVISNTDTHMNNLHVFSIAVVKKKGGLLSNIEMR